LIQIKNLKFFQGMHMTRTVLLIVLAAAICQAAVQTLSQNTLKDHLIQGAPFDFILIDLRSSGEIQELIGNKECQPYNLEWPIEFKEECVKIPKDFPVIVYCQSGGRATGAANYLSVNGYTKVFNAGGMLTWNGPKVPPSRIKPATLLPEPSMRIKTSTMYFPQPDESRGSITNDLLSSLSGQPDTLGR
jgi:phage shock protein E